MNGKKTREMKEGDDANLISLAGSSSSSSNSSDSSSSWRPRGSSVYYRNRKFGPHVLWRPSVIKAIVNRKNKKEAKRNSKIKMSNKSEDVTSQPKRMSGIIMKSRKTLKHLGSNSTESSAGSSTCTSISVPNAPPSQPIQQQSNLQASVSGRNQRLSGSPAASTEGNYVENSESETKIYYKKRLFFEQHKAEEARKQKRSKN